MSSARCIARPRLDGNTRFALDLLPQWREGISPELARVFDVAEDIRRGKLPKHEPRARQVVLSTSYDRTPWRILPRVALDISVQGERGQRIVMTAPDVFRVELDTSYSPRRHFEARCTVVFRARLLHSELEQHDLVMGWLACVQGWLWGYYDPREPIARGEYGWRATELEICADFAGDIEWRRDDAKNFVIPNGTLTTGELTTLTRGKSNSERSTVDFGTRASPASFSLYNKTAQILACKGGDDSTYAGVWRAHGWHDGENVVRAELRLKGRGIDWAELDTGSVITLRDPEISSTSGALAQLWANLTERMRLCIPGTATRRRRWHVDPRWEVVRSAARAQPVRVMQHREAQRDSHRVALYQAAKRAVAATSSYGSLLGAAGGSDHGIRTLFAHALASLPEDLRVEFRTSHPEAAYRRRWNFIGHEVAGAWAALREAHPEIAAKLRPLAMPLDERSLRQQREAFDAETPSMESTDGVISQASLFDDVG